MKIGETIYKFDADKEIAIVGGKYEEVADLKKVDFSDERVNVFYPYRNENLKSIQVGTLNYPTVFSDDGKSKLDYYLQLISFYYSGYGMSNVYYTEVGYHFKLVMQQQRKGFLGIWYNNVTTYGLRNRHAHYEYYKIGHWAPIYPNPIYIWGSKVAVNGNEADYDSPETRYGCVLNEIYYYGCDTGQHLQTNLKIYDFDVTFWSRGIGYDNRVSITNYSNY
ncbi:MAG: hypothetical protein K9H26_19100 [Prolixibacteraceae bacterium]|nr:hypothetical protein [Prolixibacteraceae bacterium]